MSTTLTLEERARGAYLGLAVGDALGATTEFMTPAEIAEQHGTHRHVVGGGWLRLEAGRVTDDTEMSLALGQSILECQGVVGSEVAKVFSEWMRTKPVDIGNTVRRGVVHFRTTGEYQVKVNEFDAGNGACMRCLPIALLHCHPNGDALHRDARIQAHTTHNNPISDMGTAAVLDMLVLALNGSGKTDLKGRADKLVQQHGAFRFDKRQMDNPSGWIVETLQAVFQAFFAHEGFEDILVDVVNRGGDADTTGAIAGMLSGALYGPEAIPHQWINTLDKDIGTACEEQADALIRLSSVSYDI